MEGRKGRGGRGWGVAEKQLSKVNVGGWYEMIIGTR